MSKLDTESKLVITIIVGVYLACSVILGHLIAKISTNPDFILAIPSLLLILGMCIWALVNLLNPFNGEHPETHGPAF